MAKFQSINNSLNKILSQYHLESAYHEKLIIESWQTCVDKKIAAIAEPVSYKSGTLILKAQSTMWKEELNKNYDHLLKMICKSFEQVSIEEIKFV